MILFLEYSLKMIFELQSAVEARMQKKMNREKMKALNSNDIEVPTDRFKPFDVFYDLIK